VKWCKRVSPGDTRNTSKSRLNAHWFHRGNNMQLNPIENLEQYMNALSKIDNLMVKEILSEDEKDLLIELAELVEEYEDEHYPI
jgi:hypothetical protein